MITCPRCQSANRDGAAFCAQCGATLKSARATQPLSDLNLALPTAAPTMARPTAPRPGSGTQPLPRLPFHSRPPLGAIFGERFQSVSLNFTNDQQYLYIIVELPGIAAPIRQCSAEACGAVTDLPDAFCTSCATPLGERRPALQIVETQTAELFGANRNIANKKLSHAHVRAPLAEFAETVNGVERFCLVSPYVGELPAHPERTPVLGWGPPLARALDYIHDNLVTFAGHITAEAFGESEGRAVWVNFAACATLNEPSPADRARDVQALARQLFRWLTGQDSFSFDPTLAAGLNEVFQRAIVQAEFQTGEALAAALETAATEAAHSRAFDYRIGRRTDLGQRPLNEDSLITYDLTRILQSNIQPRVVCAVADGMGGHAAGEVASATLVNTIAERLNAAQLDSDVPGWLKDTVAAANKALFDLRHQTGADLGSTLVIVALDGAAAHIAHVGDSRAYLINADGLRQLTTDHSLVERLVATNQITREEARHHPQRNVIYRTMGDKPQAQADFVSQPLTPGDRLLLCSDGLSGPVEDEQIQQIVMAAPSAQAASDRLIQAANAAGGDDNITAIVIEVAQIGG